MRCGEFFFCYIPSVCGIIVRMYFSFFEGNVQYIVIKTLVMTWIMSACSLMKWMRCVFVFILTEVFALLFYSSNDIINMILFSAVTHGLSSVRICNFLPIAVAIDVVCRVCMHIIFFVFFFFAAFLCKCSLHRLFICNQRGTAWILFFSTNIYTFLYTMNVIHLGFVVEQG